MPVLEPNPSNSHRKLLGILGMFLGVVVVVSIIATIAQSMG
ncbi:SGM_5486 family transporter-associated protein [Kitasatospora acidiphila]|nr:SGM_5486 family transporter-associated protein [Kitasatospora acidiphila]